MNPRDLLKPLPLILVILFVGIAVGDLVQTLTEEPLPPEIVESVVPRFRPREPIIDFRSIDPPAMVEILPIPEFESDRWSPPTPRGVWAKGKSAGLTIDIAAGDQRSVIFECLPGGGRRPVRSVRLTVNQIDCGEVMLDPGWGVYRIDLPNGALRTGPNKMEFGFKDRKGARKTRRALLIRRLALVLDPEPDRERLEAPRPMNLDSEAEKIALNVAGTLEIPLHLDDRTDAFRMRYRFSSKLGHAEIAVVKTRDGDAGISDAIKASVSAKEKLTGHLRIPLHGRRGAYVLRIHATPGESGARLLISSLRLTEEGDPSGRPWSANPIRN